MSLSQENKECSLELEDKLTDFMENGIKRRCKAIIISVHESINTFIMLFAFENNVEIKEYSMPKDIYDIMIKEATTIIADKCEHGPDHKRITKQNVTTYQRLQGYWLHHAPQITTKYLYVALLTNIANYFDDISMDIAININNIDAMSLKLDEIREFLKKKFIFNLITAHLQQHRQSNAKGPIIQFAAWKQYKLQQVISRHFDDSYHDKWGDWMQLNEKHNKSKKMRINSIIHQRFKPYSRESLRKCIEKLQIKIEIKDDFKIKPQEIEQFELFQSNIMNESQQFHFDTDIMTISPITMLPFESQQYINNIHYAPLRGTRNTVKSIRDSPMKCLKKENDKLRQQISKMKQILSQIENEYVDVHSISNQQLNYQQSAYSNNYNYINNHIQCDQNLLNNNNNINNYHQQSQHLNDEYSNIGDIFNGMHDQQSSNNFFC